MSRVFNCILYCFLYLKYFELYRANRPPEINIELKWNFCLFVFAVKSLLLWPFILEAGCRKSLFLRTWQSGSAEVSLRGLSTVSQPVWHLGKSPQSFSCRKNTTFAHQKHTESKDGERKHFPLRSEFNRWVSNRLSRRVASLALASRSRPEEKKSQQVSFKKCVDLKCEH